MKLSTVQIKTSFSQNTLDTLRQCYDIDLIDSVNATYLKDRGEDFLTIAFLVPSTNN